MIIHKVSYRSVANGSDGFSWHTSQTLAHKRARVFEKDRAGDTAGDATAEVDAVDAPTTKAALVAFLNTHAAHPNNQ